MKKIILVLAILAFVFTTCRKDDKVFENEELTEKSLTNAKIDQTFNWKTTKEVNVELSGFANKMVYLKSSKGGIFHTVFIRSTSQYNTQITVPTYEKEISILCEGKTTKLPLNTNKLIYSYNK